MSTLAYVVWLAGIVLVGVYNWRRRKLLKMLKSFYSFPTLPLIGNLHLVTGNSKERVVKLLDWIKKSEFPLVAWIFHKPVVIIATPNDMQTVLTATQHRDTLGMFKNVFGNGLILAEGEEWRKHRRLMNPAFSATMLQRYLVVFNEQSKILSKKFETLANTDKAFDLWNYMANMNLETITQNMADYKLKLQENGSNEFSVATARSLQLESMRFTQPLLFPNLIYKAYLFISGNKRTFETLHDLPRQIIRDKIAQHKSNQRTHRQTEDAEDIDAGPKTFIDLLIKVHDIDADFTEEQMHIEMLNMIMAGSESTALTSSSLLLMFAMNEDIQEKAYEEIVTIFGDDYDRPVKMEDMHRLVYLEQCIKETLRLFPVVPLSFRKHTEDIVLNDRQTIPAGVHIGVAFHPLHHNEQLYPNPECWDPEHFSEEAVRRLGKYAFLPFGAAPRNCIGSKYAMFSVKTQIVHLLRNYRFTTDMKMDDIHLVLDLALRSDTGYWIKLWCRQNNNECAQDSSCS